MSENADTPQEQDAAAEAAQNVVDEATSWEYSAEKDTIDDAVDEGLEQAGVQMDAAERRRVVEEIDDVKDGEDEGAPTVDPDAVAPADDER